MEALLILFAPLIEIVMMPVIALAGAILGAVVELIGLALGLIFGGAWEARRRKKDPQGASEAEAAPVKRKPLIPRKFVHWSAGVLAGVGVLAIAASFIFLEPILRYALDRTEEKTGVAIGFDAVEGNLLAGRVALNGVTMRRADDSGLAFDVKAERVAMDVALLSLVGGGEARIEAGEVAGVRGYVTPPERKTDAPREKKARRAFIADDLRVSDVAIEVRPRGGTPYPLEITQGQVAPLRSKLALFDLMFRSNLQARIAGQPLSVETARITEYGRETYWRFENVEADRLKEVVPRAPLTWLSGGTVSARVDDRWSLSEDWIEMDWRLRFEDVAVDLPDGLGRVEGLLGKAFAGVVKAKGGDAEFHYKIRLDEDQIAMARSGDLDAFWQVVMTGFLKDGAKSAIGRDGPGEAAVGDNEGGGEDGGKVKGAFDKVKDLLKR